MRFARAKGPTNPAHIYGWGPHAATQLSSRKMGIRDGFPPDRGSTTASQGLRCRGPRPLDPTTPSMIVSASYRTDIPAFHAAWFLARLEAGFAEVRSPYGGAPHRGPLRPPEPTGFLLATR